MRAIALAALASLMISGCASMRSVTPSMIAIPPIKPLTLDPPAVCMARCGSIPEATTAPDLETWIAEMLSAYVICSLNQQECATELQRRSDERF